MEKIEIKLMINIHRFTSNKGIELIKKFEGFSDTPYLCAAAYNTIGYGHKLSAEAQYNTISLIQAERLLKADLLKAEKAVMHYIRIELSDTQFDALVSFTFNCGAGALQRSTLRQKINYRLYDEASKEFLKWVYVGAKKIDALVRRRTLESRLFSGELTMYG